MDSAAQEYNKNRTELADLIFKEGILFRSEHQPILSRDGITTGRWMLDSLCVTLTPRGIELAGKCLLHQLKKFEQCTLATIGTTAIPLLTYCIAQSKGRYKGMLVRKERKKHGSMKLFEGPIDKRVPVVFIDDSISSGTNMTTCIQMLEAEGFRVEGGLCLVRFDWYGGFGRMQEKGYHMETVLDINRDISVKIPNEPPIIPNPTKTIADIPWHTRSVPENLHPCIAARHIMTEYLQSGKVLKPPRNLDRKYDCKGGIWVSLRSQENPLIRFARNGIWTFPEETPGTTPEDLTIAAYLTAKELSARKEGATLLQAGGIAVTLFSKMQPCTVGGLDNDRYGIVVRSRERIGKMGGALPLMPGIDNEWVQYQHARIKNGGLVSFEPHEILKHGVQKLIEPGKKWQSSGVPKKKVNRWTDHPEKAGRFSQLIRDQIVARLSGMELQPIRTLTIPDFIDSLFVTVYVNGKIYGCCGATLKSPRDLDIIIRESLQDARFQKSANPIPPEAVKITVSYLYNYTYLHNWPADEIMGRVLCGKHALMASQGQRNGLLLPIAAVQSNLKPQAFALEVIDKAGITRPPYYWHRYECSTWFADDRNQPAKLDGAFIPHACIENLDQLLPRYFNLFTRYLFRNQTDSHNLFHLYYPFQDQLDGELDTTRLAHAAWVLTRANNRTPQPELWNTVQKIRARLVSELVKDETGCLWPKNQNHSGVAMLSFLLLTFSESPDKQTFSEIIQDLANTLWQSIGVHGRIETRQYPKASHTEAEEYYLDQEQDFSSGQVILALGRACAKGTIRLNPEKLDLVFRYYCHRFRYKRRFTQVSWYMQAFGACWEAAGDAKYLDMVHEIGDWILGYQQKRKGYFLTDLHRDEIPGCSTALYLEGISAAARLAEKNGDAKRAKRYLESCLAGYRYLDSLIIQERDRPVLPNPDWAIGGLRSSQYTSSIQIDFVQHGLSAVLELLGHHAIHPK